MPRKNTKRHKRNTTMKRKLRRIRKALHAADPCCKYCHAELTFAEAHGDHVKPLKHGGRTCKKNVVLACAKCNRAKGCLTVEEFMERIAQGLVRHIV